MLRTPLPPDIQQKLLKENFQLIQTADYVRFRRDLGGGKLKNLRAGAQKCTRAGLRGGLRAAMCYYIMCYYVMC